MDKLPAYLFTSARLGFRNWKETDHIPMAEINANPVVMEFFPSMLNATQTGEFIRRMQTMFLETGYCYFAVDELHTGSFIGFIGLFYQTYEASFTPCVDVGWRLDPKFWGRGYATEGARRCLEFGFRTIHLKNIYATAPLINLRSIKVMEKTGMKKLQEFNHPKLIHDKRLERCVCYALGAIG